MIDSVGMVQLHVLLVAADTSAGGWLFPDVPPQVPRSVWQLREDIDQGALVPFHTATPTD